MNASISAADRLIETTEAAATPLGCQEFSALMDRIGAFEPEPVIGVATSGGADSLALLLLADQWARGRRGRVLALTVDHGLRPDAAREAAQVATWAAARDIECLVLSWRPDPPPSSNLQAAARQARYRLLGSACRDRGILHLMLAHHRDDQAETFLLHLARGSGLSGLASMPAIEELADLRLLRPCLAIPGARLRATLNEAGQPWIEDPSNRDRAFARVRMRGSRALLDDLGLTTTRLADAAGHLGRSRHSLSLLTDRVLAEAVAIDPAGFARLSPARLASADDEVAMRALGALIATVGGLAQSPRFAMIERLLGQIRQAQLGSGRTLGGCRLVPRGDAILVCREARAVAPPAVIEAGETLLWDGRFLVKASRLGGSGPVSVAALGLRDATRFATIASNGLSPHLPRMVWWTLPVLRRSGTIISFPYLGWADAGVAVTVSAAFRPRRALSGTRYVVS